MKSINVISLKDVTVSVLVMNEEATAGSIVVRNKESDQIISVVSIFDSKPLYECAADGTLDRTIYIQSYNSENELTDEERASVRELIHAGNFGAEWLNEGRYELFQTDRHVEGGMALEHVNGELVKSEIYIRCPALGIDTSAVLDLSNGPIHFTGTLMTDTEFFESLSAAAIYNLSH